MRADRTLTQERQTFVSLISMRTFHRTSRLTRTALERPGMSTVWQALHNVRLTVGSLYTNKEKKQRQGARTSSNHHHTLRSAQLTF